MNVIQLEYLAEVKMFIDYSPGAKKSTMKEVRVALTCPGQERILENPDGSPTPAGINISTQVLIAGLANNIQFAHDNRMRDSADHLRYIISELERHFVMVGSSSVADWNEEHKP